MKTNPKPIVVPADRKQWYALSCPVKGLRFDARTLEFLDSNHDGYIHTEEVRSALEFLAARQVTVESLAHPNPEDARQLETVRAKMADLNQLEPSAEEAAALAAWTENGRRFDEQFGDAAAAEAAYAAVEGVIETFFTPPEDMPLVTDAPDWTLPLKERINPKHQEPMLAFAAKCVQPLLGEVAELSRMNWKRIREAVGGYRAWRAAKPVANAAAKAELEQEEKLLCLKLHLGEFLANFVTMDRLYFDVDTAIFQTGVLRLGGRELHLCFHVDSEAAHSALVKDSNCCVLYLKLTRPETGETRQICAVLTAGTLAGIYVGRNGVFYDRDLQNWECVITKVVEAQVSLLEAFWAPWRKLGEGISAMAKKFLGDRQAKAMTSVQKGTESTSAGSAAMVSSVAAIGIGVGMIGAALASVLAAIRGMTPVQFVLALAAIVLLVSLPSVVLAWLKLRRRDLGAILNASGWAVNREIRFSIKQARVFTVVVKAGSAWIYALLLLLLLAAVAALSWYSSCACASQQPNTAPQTEAAQQSQVNNQQEVK